MYFNTYFKIMRQIIIKQNDIYQINSEKYFKFTIHGQNYRDYNCDLNKNNSYELRLILGFCLPEYKKLNKKLNKKQMVSLILESKCLILENT